MTTPNSPRSINDGVSKNSEKIINSREELHDFLSANYFTKFGVEKIMQSFMAKIPVGTLVKISDNMIQVGESMMNIGENMRNFGEKSKTLITQTNTRALQLLEHKLPAKTEKKSIVAANDEEYRMAA